MRCFWVWTEQSEGISIVRKEIEQYVHRSVFCRWKVTNRQEAADVFDVARKVGILSRWAACALFLGMFGAT